MRDSITTDICPECLPYIAGFCSVPPLPLSSTAEWLSMSKFSRTSAQTRAGEISEIIQSRSRLICLPLQLGPDKASCIAPNQYTVKEEAHSTVIELHTFSQEERAREASVIITTTMRQERWRRFLHGMDYLQWILVTEGYWAYTANTRRVPPCWLYSASWFKLSSNPLWFWRLFSSIR